MQSGVTFHVAIAIRVLGAEKRTYPSDAVRGPGVGNRTQNRPRGFSFPSLRNPTPKVKLW